MDITTEEAAQRAGVSASRIRQLVKSGKLKPTRRIDKAQMLAAKDVDAYFAKPQGVGWPRGRPRRAPVAPPEEDT